MSKLLTWREWLQLVSKEREGLTRRRRRRRRRRLPGWCQQPGWLTLISCTKTAACWSPPPSRRCARRTPPTRPRGPKPPWLMCQGLGACWLIRKRFTSGKIFISNICKEIDLKTGKCNTTIKSFWLPLGWLPFSTDTYVHAFVFVFVKEQIWKGQSAGKSACGWHIGAIPSSLAQSHWPSHNQCGFWKAWTRVFCFHKLGSDVVADSEWWMGGRGGIDKQRAAQAQGTCFWAQVYTHTPANIFERRCK